MKKSNKILLGGFLVVLLLITGIHVSLYAKYRAGHYTIYQPVADKELASMTSFPGVSVVTIRNGNAVISFGDQLSVEKDKNENVRYLQQGDSLVVTAGNEAARFQNTKPVKLILPNNVTLSAFNSNISFEKGRDNAGTNADVSLYNSQAVFEFSRKTLRLGHVKLHASDNSVAIFQGNAELGQLEVQLSNSSLEYNGGDIGQLSIATDSTSRLMLQSKHLLKAKITQLPNNP